MTEEQLAFDIEAMLHESAVEAAPEWSGAPLAFTTAYWTPPNLEAAHEHWQFLHKLDQSRTQSRMWHRAIAVPGRVAVGDHGFDLFTADLRCEPWTHGEAHGGCQCVGDLIYQAICEPDGWHVIASDENSAVEGWHDHAFPGWRERTDPAADGVRDRGSCGAQHVRLCRPQCCVCARLHARWRRVPVWAGLRVERDEQGLSALCRARLQASAWQRPGPL